MLTSSINYPFSIRRIQIIFLYIKKKDDNTGAKFSFYLALYVSVGQEPKHIMAR